MYITVNKVFFTQTEPNEVLVSLLEPNLTRFMTKLVSCRHLVFVSSTVVPHSCQATYIGYPGSSPLTLR